MKNNMDFFPKIFLLTLFLVSNTLFAQENTELYASVEEDRILVLEPSFAGTKTNLEFKKKYHYLVARAYFKLLAEAHEAERQLKAEFEQYAIESKRFDRQENRVLHNKTDLLFKKYNAHRAMLSGLKSWNLFSEDRTKDMFYFMAKNEDRIFKMYRRNLHDDKMVKYLIYKLADLYHLEEEN